MEIAVGLRYKFKGYEEKDGHVVVLSISQHNVYWCLLSRKGHPFNGKEMPFDFEGKYIGNSRWQVPDLEREIEVELEIEEEVEIELEVEEKELEL